MFSKVYKPFALLTMPFQENGVKSGVEGGYEWRNARIKTWNPYALDAFCFVWDLS